MTNTVTARRPEVQYSPVEAPPVALESTQIEPVGPKRLLAFAGRKQAGKDSAADYLHGLKLFRMGIIEDFGMDDDGRLQLPIPGEYSKEEGTPEYYIADFYDLRNPAWLAYLGETVWPHVRKLCLATPLKAMCRNLLNVDHDGLYGTNECKSAGSGFYKLAYEAVAKSKDKKKASSEEGIWVSKELTNRDLMREVALFFTSVYDDVFVDYLIKVYQDEDYTTSLTIIPDVRRPNEIERIKQAGGRVIKLDKKIDEDEHFTEASIDARVYDQSKFDAVIDNSQMSIFDKNKEIADLVTSWGWI